MRFKQSPADREAQEITRLVDQAPVDSEQAQGDAWADRPEIRRQVASQRRVADALREGGPSAPDRLLTAVEARVRDAYGPGAERSGRRRRATGPAWRPAVALTALAAVCAVVVIAAVGVGGGGSGSGSGSGSGPSIPAAAALAFAPSTGPAPAAQSPKLLDVSYGGVTYPNYAKFAIPPAGRRTDRIGGRPALTVFYRLPGGTPLSYTVFSGKAVPLPHSARAVVFHGVPLHVFTTSSGLSVVTLVRFGRTCVLAAKVTPDTVLALAAAPVLAQATA
jgi:hypothetical protein